jgi:dipeptidyl aminopeptidase/acylaminoacyl peptidase
MKKLTFILGIVVLLNACKQEMKEQENSIQQQVQKTENGLMNDQSLWFFGRISDIRISPDKSKLLYGVTYFDIAENKGNRELYIYDFQTGTNTQITKTAKSEGNALWRPDGKKIGFLYPAQNGSMQMFEMDIDGANRKQVSDIEGGLKGFSYAPDMKHIAYFATGMKKPTAIDKHPDLEKANARIIDDVMYRHWDHWVKEYDHIFIAEYNENSIQSGTNIMSEEPWEAPVRPFGGMEQIAWHPNGKSIVYTCRKLEGLAYSLSTNTDLYKYDIEHKTTINLTEGMLGYDKNPVFSPDGKYLAWQSMERPGYEADKYRLFVMDMESKEKKYVTEQFDANANNLTWSDDGKSMYFLSEWYGSVEIFNIGIDDTKPKQITDGIHDYIALQLGDNSLITMKQSMSKPAEIYKVNLQSGEDVELSFVNKEQLEHFRMGNVEKRWITTTDNKKMLTWVIYPPDFDPKKKYPTLLYCQGGPQGMVSQFWSYRWNFQMMAAHGYIIVAPNRRGVPGFGMEWLEQISGDYGGQNIRDYLSAIDELAKEPFVDENKLGAIGASYGGYSVFHLAGIHNKRFKAFISHAGIFNFDAQYLETEELFFPNWDYGGAFWETNNAVIKRSYAASPHHFVQNWDTPILIIHGELDYRISFTQSMQAFNAAQILGVPSRLLLFPDENHWILKPHNAILWQREFFQWLDTYLK